MTRPELVTHDAVYPESPRWHDGELWFSDVHAYAVKAVDTAGTVRTVVDVPGRPAGLGFLPDGSLLIAGALDRRLWRWDGTSLHMLADLSPMVHGLLNDMVVDARGRAYVGDTGFNLMAGEPPRAGAVITVDTGGDMTPVVAASGVQFPNGAALDEPSHTLWLSETTARRVTRFRIGSDGRLSEARTVIDLPGLCDGLCVDHDGNVWVALLEAGEFWHVAPDGAVLQALPTDGRLAIACVLGGPDRRDLYLCSAATTMAELAHGSSRGLIHRLRVDTAGAGRP
jgi:sugar lactone lactonase YvrE